MFKIELSHFLDKNGKLSSRRIAKNLTEEMRAELHHTHPGATSDVELIYLNRHSIEIPKCVVCNQKRASFKNGEVGYSQWCGVSCATKASVRRGRSSHLASPHIRDKIKATLMRNYGVDNANKIVSVRERSKQTCLERYGATTWLASEHAQIDRSAVLTKECRQKAAATMTKNWLAARLASISENFLPAFDDWKGCLEEHDFICKKCDSRFAGWLRDGVDPRCPSCHPTTISAPHRIVCKWLTDAGIEFENNNRRILSGLELDIVAGDIAIEINGCYWHSLHGANYHANKTRLASSAGIRLMHVFEDEILDNPDETRRIILNHFFPPTFITDDHTIITENRWFWYDDALIEMGYTRKKNFTPTYWLVGNANRWRRQSPDAIEDVSGYNKIWDCGSTEWVFTPIT